MSNGSIPAGVTLDPDIAGQAPAAAPSTPPATGAIPPGITLDPDITQQGDGTAEQPSALHRFGQSFLSGMGITSDEQAKAFFEHPINTMIHAFEQQGQLAVNARDAYRKRDYASAVMHGLNYLVPFIGQQTDVAGQQLQKRDIAGGVGTTLGLGITTALGAPEGRAAIAGAAKTAGEVAKAGVGAAKAAAPELIGGGIGAAAGRAMGGGFGAEGIGAMIGGRMGRAIAKDLATKAGPPSAEAQAALETVTPADVQPSLQSGIRSILSDTAGEQGIEVPSGDVLLRDWGEDMANKMQAKSQEIFRPIDEATQGKWTKIQDALNENTNKLRQAVDPDVEAKLKDQRLDLYVQSIKAMNAARDAGVDLGIVDQAKEAWKQSSGLTDFDIEVKHAMPGHLQRVGAEHVDPGSFSDRMQKLRDIKPFGTRRLEDALGSTQARRMLHHSYDSQAAATEKPSAPTGPEVTKEMEEPPKGSRVVGAAPPKEKEKADQ